MSLTYIIEAPDYDKNVGGFCALHFLADQLVALGVENVYLTASVLNPRWRGKSINKDDPFFFSDGWLESFYLFLTKLRKFVYFNTFKRKLIRLQKKIFPHLLWKYFDKEKTVVICGEALKGVPHDAKHVVRWIMNTPGVCGGDGIYQLTDHIFQYHPSFAVNPEYEVKGQLIAIDLDYQLKTYKNHHLQTRKGGAYIVRKGRNKKLDQHPVDFMRADSLLEKMTDEEAAAFFNSIETFISYDDMTWISVQAALCGCRSIIIPGEGDRSLENIKKINRIKGVAYGFEDEQWVNDTIDHLRSHYETVNTENLGTIKAFYEYCEKTMSIKATD